MVWYFGAVVACLLGMATKEVAASSITDTSCLVGPARKTASMPAAMHLLIRTKSECPPPRGQEVKAVGGLPLPDVQGSVCGGRQVDGASCPLGPSRLVA